MFYLSKEFFNLVKILLPLKVIYVIHSNSLIFCLTLRFSHCMLQIHYFVVCVKVRAFIVFCTHDQVLVKLY